MFFVDLFTSLIFNFVKSIVILSIEAMKIFSSLKSTFFAVWLSFSLILNVIWIVRKKAKNQLIIPMAHLICINFIVIGVCIEIHWIWNITVLFPGGDVLCKFLKWSQTTSVMITSALIIHIINLFRYHQRFQSKTKICIMIMWVISPLLAYPQVRIKGFF